VIRGYRPSDLPALRRICVLTGAAGMDATGRWSDDALLPDAFLEPYPALEPGSAFVLELDGVPAGYVVGTVDTREFVARWRDDWLPEARRRHPGRAPSAEERWLWDALLQPEGMLTPFVDECPAHLHIDLLPAAQGRGWGRALMRAFGARAVAAGAGGIHLRLDQANTGAIAFYERLGFTMLEPGTYGIASERLAAEPRSGPSPS
jgi:ribosomal protein S18 acetylase RimI-like enzyme